MQARQQIKQPMKIKMNKTVSEIEAADRALELLE